MLPLGPCQVRQRPLEDLDRTLHVSSVAQATACSALAELLLHTVVVLFPSNLRKDLAPIPECSVGSNSEAAAELR